MNKIILLFTLLLTQFIFSQKESKINSSNQKTYTWTFKTDVLRFIVGELPLIYEQKVSKKISIEGAAAVVYGYYPNSPWMTSGWGDGEQVSTKPALGYLFSLGAKFYPSSDWDTLEGYSFGIQAFTKTKNRRLDRSYNINDSFDLANYKGSEIDSKNKTGALVTISKQYFSASNISHEYYVGIGLAYVTRNYIYGNYDYDNINVNKHPIRESSTAESTPVLNFGFRIGFGN